MNVIDVETLLFPIDAAKVKPPNVSPTAPPPAVSGMCGYDLSDSLEYAGLEDLATSREKRPEVLAKGLATLKERCLELFGKTRDLQLGLYLALGLLRADGVEGFRDGLSLLRHMVERYWADLYPRLEPMRSEKQAAVRFSVLDSLSPPPGGFGDTFVFVLRFREAALAESSAGPVTLKEWRAAKAVPADKPVEPGVEELQNRLATAPPEQLTARHQALAEGLAHLEGLAKFLKGVNAPGAPQFAELRREMIEAVKIVEPYLPKREETSAVTAAADRSADGPNHENDRESARPPVSSQPVASGDINTRDHVKFALDRIGEYFKRNEPDSPLAMLLPWVRTLLDRRGYRELMKEPMPKILAEVELSLTTAGSAS